MRAAVALVVALSLGSTACFPHSAKGRTIAKTVEGGLLVGGIVMLTVVNSGADCDGDGPGLNPDEDCEDRAALLSNIGLGLILAGLVGFIVTVSTSPEDDAVAVSRSPVAVPVRPAPPRAPAPAASTPAPTAPAESTPAESTPAESAPAESAPVAPGG